MAATVQRPGIGVEGLVVAVLTSTSDVAGGTPSYGTVLQLAGLAKLTVNSNGSVATDYADDGPSFAATTTGKIQVDLELTDVIPSSWNTIFGVTYANGILQDTGLDTSPYIALGYKQWLGGLDGSGNKVYRYVWLGKGVLAKPLEGGTTKKDTISYEHITIKGEFLKLTANGNYRTSVRTDDSNASATTITNWFNQPVITAQADLSAFTVAVSTGSGATKTLLFTFSKASASGSIPFTLSSSVIAAMASTVQILNAATGALVPATYAILSAGTGFSNSTITVTATTTLAATSVYVSAPVNDDLVDGSGVTVSAYQSGPITTHA